MKILSLKQFIQQQEREPQDIAPRTLLVTVEDLRDALGVLGDDRTLEVKVDYPKIDTITVNLIPQEDETEQ